jgi:hypothetical protein
MASLWIAPLVVVLITVLSRPAIIRVQRDLLADRKELILFALFEAAAIGAMALLLIAVGPQAAGAVLVALVVLFSMWVMKPPAKRR